MPHGCLGKFLRGGGPAELVHLTIDHEPQVFLYRPCHGDVQIYVLYIDGHSPFALFDGQPDSWVSILNCGMTRWSFRWERSMTGHISPVFFGTRKEMAEETLGFWMGGGRWFPLQHDCRQVCVMHGNCLVGSATVGQRWAPHRLHLDENIESASVPYLAAHLVNFSDAFRHPAGMVKFAGMVKDPKDPSRWGDLMGVIQVMTPLSVCSSLSCWTLQ